VNENIVWAFSWDEINITPSKEFTRTLDGGQTWIPGFLDEVDAGLYSGHVFAFNGDTAWLCTSSLQNPVTGKVYKTTDGGETWIWVDTLFNGFNQAPTAIHFFDAEKGVTFGAPFSAFYNNQILIYTTSDGGNSWTEVAVPAQLAGEGITDRVANGVYAAIGSEIWFPSTKGRVFKSSDYGNTWAVYQAPLQGVEPQDPISIAMKDPLNGLLISDNPNEAFRTTDGGETWIPIVFPSQPAAFQIEYIPETEGTYLIHDGFFHNSPNLLVTYDDGDSWEIIPTNASMESFEFLSPTVGFGGASFTHPNFGGMYKWSGEPLVSPTVLVESFESLAQPEDWTAEGYWEFGNSATHSSDFFQIPEHGGFAVLNDDLLGSAAIAKDKLILPRLDFTHYEDVRLIFESFFVNGDYNGVDETAKVLVSTDSLVTWQEVSNQPTGSQEWQTTRVDLSAFAGQKIHLAFEFDDGGEWNYGWAIDDVSIGLTPAYDAEGRAEKISAYSINTPKHLTPLKSKFAVENFGSETLTGTIANLEILLEGNPYFNTNLPLSEIASFTTHQDSIALPSLSSLGNYDFGITANHPEVGGIFLQNEQKFILSDSVLARDDGSRETSIGFPFGNPNWYGYYGSEFELQQTDTLTGISIWISSNTAGAFNLVINTKDELGIPNVEVFHSQPIPVTAGYNDWVYFHLPAPLVLPPDVYLFAAGQDTVQGIHGFGMDATSFNPTYWIMGLLPTYDWVNYQSGGFNYNLMIRPHFNPQGPSSAWEVNASHVSLSPNPATSVLNIQLPEGTIASPTVQVFDAQGRLVLLSTGQQLDVQALAPGMYSLRAVVGERVFVGRFVKQ
jgi:photosystem II stability/assembly factor-like uncharacterized protein